MVKDNSYGQMGEYFKDILLMDNKMEKEH